MEYTSREISFLITTDFKVSVFSKYGFKPSTNNLVDLVSGKIDEISTFDKSTVNRKKIEDQLQNAINHLTDKICYNISGGNTAILIGKRGQTLEAMQYLVEKIVNKQIGRRIRLEIDVEGYLIARRERLESLAQRLGEKVKRTGKPLTAGQFNAHDRRIIHIALKEDNAVRTHSVGEGYYRKLKIFFDDVL